MARDANKELPRIWVLEDDLNSLFVYQKTLESHFEVTPLGSLGDLSKMLKASPPPALLIADLGLPDGYFLTFLRKKNPDLRNRMPILVVSSIDELETLEHCFHEGASDYLVKPFNKTELLAKVRRYTVATPVATTAVIPGLRLRLDRSLLESDFGCSAQLTLREMQVLEILTRCGEHGITRNDLAVAIWEGNGDRLNLLDVYLSKLRKKLEPTLASIHRSEDGKYTLSADRMDRRDSLVKPTA